MTYRNDQVSAAETEKILNLARTCLDVDGDFVEFGCYRGDTSILLATILRDYQQNSFNHRRDTDDNNNSNDNSNNNVDDAIPNADTHKTLWLYDSFEGLPAKSAADDSAAGAEFQSGALATTKRAVKNRFLRTNLKVPRIVKAWFSDLTPADLPARIAFAFLDGDFYHSIKTSLALVAPKLSQNGLIVVHDYLNPALPGVTRAIDEFLQSYQSHNSAARVTSAPPTTNADPEKASQNQNISDKNSRPASHHSSTAPRLTRYHSLAILQLS